MSGTGTTIGDNAEVGKASIVEQCKAVLNAGGTVYIGEDHTQKHGREICLEVLNARCVQYFCIEHDVGLQGTSLEELAFYLDNLEEKTAIGHHPPIKMSTLLKACAASGGETILMDKQFNKTRKTTSKVRQAHMRSTVSACRSGVNKIGRGVLVLVGSDHLRQMSAWNALHEMVYTGLSFMHGRYGSCYMVWQLS